MCRCKELGSQSLKGMDTPVPVYQVLGEGIAQSRLEVAATHWLDAPGWAGGRSGAAAGTLGVGTDGLGQAVVLSGEAGVGKSRLVQVLKEHVAEGGPVLECRASPYHQHSALYPVIELWQRLWQLAPGECSGRHVRKLEVALAIALPLDQTVALLAALLSLPLPADRRRRWH